MNREKITFIVSVMVMAALIFTPSCATQKKLQRLRNGETPQVQLTLGNQPDFTKHFQPYRLCTTLRRHIR